MQFSKANFCLDGTEYQLPQVQKTQSARLHKNFIMGNRAWTKFGNMFSFAVAFSFSLPDGARKRRAQTNLVWNPKVIVTNIVTAGTQRLIINFYVYIEVLPRRRSFKLATYTQAPTKS